jgi:hypothetical protein
LSYQSYSKVLEELCDILGIVVDKKMHFGRHYEIMDGKIKYIGLDTQNNVGN